MHRKSFVDERVVRRQQVQHIAVLAKDAVKKHLRLGAHRLPEVVIKIRVNHAFRCRTLHGSQLQPLAGKIFHQFLRAWIGQHPPDLTLKDVCFLQLSLRGQVDQFVIRASAPQEK